MCSLRVMTESKSPGYLSYTSCALTKSVKTWELLRMHVSPGPLSLDPHRNSKGLGHKLFDSPCTYFIFTVPVSEPEAGYASLCLGISDVHLCHHVPLGGRIPSGFPWLHFRILLVCEVSPMSVSRNR